MKTRAVSPILVACLGLLVLIAARPAPLDAAPAAASPPVTLLADIDSFGFHSRTAMGVGGFLTTRIFPVVLFRNGDALLDVEGLAHPGGLAARRSARAKDWTRWHRAGGELQLERPGKGGVREWRKLHFQTTYPKLPAGFRLDGRYENDGLTLRLRWDDGRSESRILVADPNDPKTALWLDGVGYVRR